MKVPIIFEGIPGGDIFSDGNEEKHDCTDDIFERGAYIIEGISGGVNPSKERGVEEEDASSLATFEVCHCTNGHQEHILSQPVGQGVHKTPGEAPTTISGKRSGQSSRSRPTTGDSTGLLY